MVPPLYVHEVCNECCTQVQVGCYCTPVESAEWNSRLAPKQYMEDKVNTYSTRMSPESIHKLMEFYMEV